MPNRRENVSKSAGLVPVVATRVGSLDTPATFTFAGDNYRWFYICRRRA